MVNTDLIIPAKDLEPKICFERDGYIFCNWVNHPTKKNYAIVSAFGKFLRFIERNKSGKKNEKNPNQDD